MPMTTQRVRAVQFTLLDLFALTTVIALALGGVLTAYRSPGSAIIMYVLVGCGQIVLSVCVYPQRRQEDEEDGSGSRPIAQTYDMALLGSLSTLGTWVLWVGWLLAYGPVAADSNWTLAQVTEDRLGPTFFALLLGCLVVQLATFLVNPVGLLMMRGWVRHWHIMHSSLLRRYLSS